MDILCILINMITPDTNHRYRGYRESKKLVDMLQCGLADLTTIALSTMQQRDYYDNNIVECNTTSTTADPIRYYRETVDDTTPLCFEDLEQAFQTIIQHARELVIFTRRLI